jgi:hypothetical protein
MPRLDAGPIRCCAPLVMNPRASLQANRAQPDGLTGIPR